MDNAVKNVTEALEMAAEELRDLVLSLRDEGAEAYRVRDTKSFQRINAQLEAVEQFQRLFIQLQQDWAKISKQTRTRDARTQPTIRPRASSGQLLPERAYVFPILQALKDAGGSASVRDVLREVEARIGNRLTQEDRKTLRTGQIRWENRAQWVRKGLVMAGLLNGNAPRGLWEIMPDGLSELEANDLDTTWAKVTAAQRAPTG